VGQGRLDIGIPESGFPCPGWVLAYPEKKGVKGIPGTTSISKSPTLPKNLGKRKLEEVLGEGYFGEFRNSSPRTKEPRKASDNPYSEKNGREEKYICNFRSIFLGLLRYNRGGFQTLAKILSSA